MRGVCIHAHLNVRSFVACVVALHESCVAWVANVVCIMMDNLKHVTRVVAKTLSLKHEDAMEGPEVVNV